MSIRLYNYFNSSTSFRVRIALALKGVEFEYVAVNLRVQGQRDPAFVALNPSASVPLLVEGGLILSQSLAIIGYLDARYPQLPLLPRDPVKRARVLELAHVVACDIHPVNNLRVQQYLKKVLGATDEETKASYRYWVAEGLGAIEALLARHAEGPFCCSDSPSLADCCLVPQVFNALRLGCDVKAFPRVMTIYSHCMGLPEFQAAAPMNQIDYVESTSEAGKD